MVRVVHGWCGQIDLKGDVARLVHMQYGQSGLQVVWSEWFTSAMARVVHRWCGQGSSHVVWPDQFTVSVARTVHR